MDRRLRRSDLPVDTVALARFLVDKILVHDLRGQRTSGHIVEVEAYPVGDPAGHTFGGKMQRNASLYLARGHAYVYFVYGMYYCLNISSEKPGIGACVLLRALEPLEGIELMKKRRPSSSLRDLAMTANFLNWASHKHPVKEKGAHTGNTQYMLGTNKAV
jgi:DNA-3-methyladenine glycosylase